MNLLASTCRAALLTVTALGMTAFSAAAEGVFDQDLRLAPRVFAELTVTLDAMPTFAINPADGTLKEIQRVSSNGVSPWAFRIDASGKWMLIANMDSNRVDVFSIDTETGMIAPTEHSVDVPKPQIVVFY